MQAAARATPSSSERPGYFWPLSVRQCRAPMPDRQIDRALLPLDLARPLARSGCVKSGEKHSIDEICPVSAIASMTGATSCSS